MKKYVITGGPGIGKTTVIEILASRGYKIVPEAARIIIEEGKRKGGDILPWVDLEKFQKAVAEKQIELEEKCAAEVAFQDRGVIDGYGYCINGKVPVPEVIEKLPKNYYYKVFVLEPLPIYENDKARWEVRDECLRIHQAIIDAYKHFGYELIMVPVLPPEERVDFILQYLL